MIKDAKVQEKLLKAEAGKGENDIEMGELEVESKKDELDFICELIEKLNDLDSKILERLRERQRLKLDGLYQEVDGCASADTLRDLLAKVSENWSFEGGLDGTSARGLQLAEAFPESFILEEKFKGRNPWIKSLGLKDGADLDTAKQAVLSKIKDWKQSVQVYSLLEDKPLSNAKRWPRHISIAMLDLLKAPDCYSANLGDRELIKKQINLVAQIDCLPPRNSFQAMQLLRACW